MKRAHGDCQRLEIYRRELWPTVHSKCQFDGDTQLSAEFIKKSFTLVASTEIKASLAI